MNNQTNHPYPDFKIGNKVVSRGIEGKIIANMSQCTFPILVRFDNGATESFTVSGKYNVDGEVELFSLEESDKPESSQQDEDNALFQTFQDIANWLKDNTQIVYGEWYVGTGGFIEPKDVQELYNLYKASRHE